MPQTGNFSGIGLPETAKKIADLQTKTGISTRNPCRSAEPLLALINFMKQAIYLTILVFIGTMVPSCKAPISKEDQAKIEVSKAEAALDKAYEDLDQAAKESAWAAFLEEAEKKIIRNDDRISELKSKRAMPGNAVDPVYSNRIEVLERQNATIRARIADSKNHQTDWKTFQEEVNSELDDIGTSINEFIDK
jgi:hypothetical protein